MTRDFIRAALKPSPLMGEGWVGVNVCARTGLAGSPHPKPLPIKGRGFQLESPS